MRPPLSPTSARLDGSNDMLARMRGANAQAFAGYALILALDQVSSSVTPTLIQDWIMPVEISKVYRVMLTGKYTTATQNTGGAFNITATHAAAGNILGSVRAAVDTANIPIVVPRTARLVLELAQPFDTLPANFVTEGVSGPGQFQADFSFVCTHSGDLEFRWGSEVAASNATLKAGSIAIVQQIG